MILRTENIRGVDVELTVNENGKFYASWKGMTGDSPSADSLADLRIKVAKALSVATKKLELEATLIQKPTRSHWAGKSERPELRPIVITGWSTQQRRPLAKFADGKKETVSYDYLAYGSVVLQRLDPDDAARWLEVYNEKQRADEAYDEFVATHKMDVRKTVSDLIGEAIE